MLKIEFFRTADVDQVAVVLPAAERANDVKVHCYSHPFVHSPSWVSKVERLLSTPVWRTAAPATVPIAHWVENITSWIGR